MPRKVKETNIFKMPPAERAKYLLKVHRKASQPPPKERSELIKALGRHLKEKREERRMTLKEVGLESGKQLADVQKIEKGTMNPTVETLEAIAKALNYRLEIRLIRPKADSHDTVEETDKIICDRIKQIRKESGRTQVEFAESIDENLPYIKAVEQGRFNPSKEVLKKIALVYNCSIDWIYGLKD